jgi:predicted nucleic acid-binding protein
MIFVDRSVWFSAALKEDQYHATCRMLLEAAVGELVTTDYVIDELLTLLSVRGYRDVAIAAGARLWSGKAAPVVLVTPDDLAEAWRIFQSYRDKQWSFTDCTSYAVMQRLGITEALSLDDHFRQFGFASVLP